MHNIRCQTCGLRPISTVTKWGVRNDCCGLWSWGEKPLVDAATHEARKAAHEAFDPLWKDGHMSRAQAYAELRRVTGLNEKNCHMSRMDKGRAERVIPAVQQIFEGLHR